MIKFGQFECYLTGVFQTHNAEDLNEHFKNLFDKPDEYGFVIYDAKNNDNVGSAIIKDTGNPFPLRFKTFEEARTALEYINEIYQRATGDMTTKWIKKDGTEEILCEQKAENAPEVLSKMRSAFNDEEDRYNELFLDFPDEAETKNTNDTQD